MSPQLQTKLRRIRLAHMATHVEALNAESIRQQHSYLEFLSALVEGELSARDNNARLSHRTSSPPRLAIGVLPCWSADASRLLSSHLTIRPLRSPRGLVVACACSTHGTIASIWPDHVALPSEKWVTQPIVGEGGGNSVLQTLHRSTPRRRSHGLA
jgi:hypothetical protein